MNLWNYQANDVDQVDGAAALEKRQVDPVPRGNPWGPWTDDKEKRQHEPHAEGNPWGPWTEDKE